MELEREREVAKQGQAEQSMEEWRVGGARSSQAKAQCGVDGGKSHGGHWLTTPRKRLTEMKPMVVKRAQTESRRDRATQMVLEAEGEPQ